jgi:chemotaxis protein methyltransferase CheR
MPSAPEPGAATPQADELEHLETELVLEGIYRHYGLDFRDYARASVQRRLWRRVHLEGLSSLTGLLERVLHDPLCMERLQLDLSIQVTAMFRDPSFYRAFREIVVPLLATYPYVRVWDAGCSTGEEALSLAILLEEEGMLGRTQIYATDMNQPVLTRAASGTVPLERMREYTQNYIASGGRRSFSEYYETTAEEAVFDARLLANVHFAQHNLVTDGPFNTFHVIVCRNVMIYFTRPLQDRVHGLFLSSLERLGVLALGQRESLRFSAHVDSYLELDADERLYRRRA